MAKREYPHVIRDDGREYPTIAAAARDLMAHGCAGTLHQVTSNISRVLHGNGHLAYGRGFRFKEVRDD